MKVLLLFLQIIIFFLVVVGIGLTVVYSYISFRSQHFEFAYIASGIGAIIVAIAGIKLINRYPHVSWKDLLILIP